MSDYVLLILPTLLMIAGLPIYVALLATSIMVIMAFEGLPISSVHQMLFGGLDKYTLLAIPFFIFAGEVMGRGGISDKILDWTQVILRGARGNLALSTVGSSTIFGAISGSSPATVAAIGKLTYPRMVREGYDPKFAIGLVTSCGAIAAILPPSIAMILYGAASQTSVSDLFLAGIIPGIFIALILALYITFISPKNTSTKREGGLREILIQTRAASWALGTPVVILGGIYLGIFSPTEAGGIACVYGVLVARYAYRLIGWKQMGRIAADSAYLTAKILIIVGAANIYSWLLTISGMPQQMVEVFESANMSPLVALAVLNVAFLIIGCFLDPASAILILTPLLMPLVQALGIDPVHFGIILTVNLSIGMFTPPIGLNIFVAQTIFDGNYKSILQGIVPFFSIYILCLGVITYLPAMSLLLL